MCYYFNRVILAFMKDNLLAISLVVAIGVIVFLLLPLGFYFLDRFAEPTSIPDENTIEQPFIDLGPIPGASGLQVVSPNGGEKLCFNQGYPIQWRSSAQGVVEMLLRKPDGDTYKIGSFPSRYGGTIYSDLSIFQWTVGAFEEGFIPSGGMYEILILHEGAEDRSDGFFTIAPCGSSL